MRGGLLAATVDVETNVLIPKTSTLAAYDRDVDGVWVYIGEVEVINFDEGLTIYDKVYCVCFLDPETGQYEPFPSCNATALTIPAAPGADG